jgi:hypothetical protein
VSSATVQRAWQEHPIYPHRVSTFKMSKATAEQVQASAQRITAGVPWVRLALVGPDYQGEELLAATEAA